ncbi:NUDIX domain-containing protein [Rhodalgimonas zhirmunskyi]|uniref:NUDIX domain-containing protein n=1 Tax=Rhodalgimonas zhirmunskyi TaxID=2964767 RepID=A0AAJ1UDA1_9RHOB|nr:NUDIX domain-containing protein [Rhodoalgimonas zhirmunskyi]MDQ2093822.1 NUDIX domain-containing protein [Rhodoalgimonas zhirmunskyi]
MSGFRDMGAIPERIEWRGAAVMAFDATGRALMQLRDDIPQIAAPGKWSFFGGAVDPGEALDTAARREFLEETGIDIAQDEISPVARFASVFRNNGVIHVYRLHRTVAPHEPRLGEGAGFAFLTRRQVESFALIEGFREILLGLDHLAP